MSGARAALPAKALVYVMRGATKESVNVARERGGSLAVALKLVEVSDNWQELQALFDAAFAIRAGEVEGTLESVEAVNRTDAYHEADDRNASEAALALIHEAAPREKVLFAADRAIDSARADAAADIRKLAEWVAYRGRLQARRA